MTGLQSSLWETEEFAELSEAEQQASGRRQVKRQVCPYMRHLRRPDKVSRQERGVAGAAGARGARLSESYAAMGGVELPEANQEAN